MQGLRDERLFVSHLLRYDVLFQGLILSSSFLPNFATSGFAVFPLLKTVVCHCLLFFLSFLQPSFYRHPSYLLIPLLFFSSPWHIHFLAGLGFNCFDLWISVSVCGLVCICGIFVCIGAGSNIAPAILQKILEGAKGKTARFICWSLYPFLKKPLLCSLLFFRHCLTSIHALKWEHM